MTRCKHGLEMEFCSYCNGTSAKKEQELREYTETRKTRNLRIKKKREFQNETKMFAENDHVKYTEEELKFLTEHLEGEDRNSIELFRDLALEMKRTYNAIDFIWQASFSEKFRNMKIETGHSQELKRFDERRKGDRRIFERGDEDRRKETPVQ